MFNQSTAFEKKVYKVEKPKQSIVPVAKARIEDRQKAEDSQKQSKAPSQLEIVKEAIKGPTSKSKSSSRRSSSRSSSSSKSSKVYTGVQPQSIDTNAGKTSQQIKTEKLNPEFVKETKLIGEQTRQSIDPVIRAKVEQQYFIERQRNKEIQPSTTKEKVAILKDQNRTQAGKFIVGTKKGFVLDYEAIRRAKDDPNVSSAEGLGVIIGSIGGVAITKKVGQVVGGTSVALKSSGKIASSVVKTAEAGLLGVYGVSEGINIAKAPTRQAKLDIVTKSAIRFSAFGLGASQGSSRAVAVGFKPSPTIFRTNAKYKDIVIQSENIQSGKTVAKGEFKPEFRTVKKSSFDTTTKTRNKAITQEVTKLKGKIESDKLIIKETIQDNSITRELISKKNPKFSVKEDINTVTGKYQRQYLKEGKIVKEIDVSGVQKQNINLLKKRGLTKAQAKEFIEVFPESNLLNTQSSIKSQPPKARDINLNELGSIRNEFIVGKKGQLTTTKKSSFEVIEQGKKYTGDLFSKQVQVAKVTKPTRTIKSEIVIDKKGYKSNIVSRVRGKESIQFTEGKSKSKKDILEVVPVLENIKKTGLKSELKYFEKIRTRDTIKDLSRLYAGKESTKGFTKRNFKITDTELKQSELKFLPTKQVQQARAKSTSVEKLDLNIKFESGPQVNTKLRVIESNKVDNTLVGLQKQYKAEASNKALLTKQKQNIVEVQESKGVNVKETINKISEKLNLRESISGIKSTSTKVKTSISGLLTKSKPKESQSVYTYKSTGTATPRPKQIDITGSKSKTDIRQTQKPTIKYDSSIKSEVIPEQDQKIQPKVNVRPTSKSRRRTNIKEIQDIKVNIDTPQIQDFRIKPKQTNDYQEIKSTYKYKSPLPIIQEIPRLRIGVPQFTGNRNNNFEVFVKRFGKDVSIGKASTQAQAASKLRNKLTSSARASGFVTFNKSKISLSLGTGFTKSKKDKFRVVQKRGTRIKSLGELTEITRKGQQIRRKGLRL